MVKKVLRSSQNRSPSFRYPSTPLQKKVTARFFLLVWLERGSKKAGYGAKLVPYIFGFSAPQFPNFDISNCLLEGL